MCDSRKYPYLPKAKEGYYKIQGEAQNCLKVLNQEKYEPKLEFP